MTTHDSVEDVHIDGDVIRLGQFLKLASLIDSGANAKEVIVDGDVLVNGAPELRRGYQLKDGDLVTFHDRSARVRY
ncbi:RNA-binding S4 domain-containing protein [Demequina aurantiaca]|uniref:RNA-binding S4 domain-containing protein n=1 Tax=Demequina aurantiaca TaxID=676200 RepID=UPI0007832847|nr:RNA-binding S4 domain-containing protein [Demequina aurantiaca]